MGPGLHFITVNEWLSVNSTVSLSVCTSVFIYGQINSHIKSKICLMVVITWVQLDDQLPLAMCFCCLSNGIR